jgi:RNA polymerase sigma factor (sigma-70 family)
MCNLSNMKQRNQILGSKAAEKKIINGFLAGNNEEYKIVESWISTVLHLSSWHYTIKANKNDILQNVLIILIENFRNNKYQWRGLKTYVSTITKFNCLKIYDKNSNIETLENEPVSGNPNAEEKIIDNERWELLKRVIEKMDNNCRKMFVFRYYNKLGHNDIAERLNTSAATSRQWLKRCLDRAKNLAREMENL